MADHDDKDWGPKIAKLTFVATILGVIGFAGAIIVFILSRNV
jgi:hypothetical protein